MCHAPLSPHVSCLSLHHQQSKEGKIDTQKKKSYKETVTRHPYFWLSPVTFHREIIKLWHRVSLSPWAHRLVPCSPVMYQYLRECEWTTHANENIQLTNLFAFELVHFYPNIEQISSKFIKKFKIWFSVWSHPRDECLWWFLLGAMLIFGLLVEWRHVPVGGVSTLMWCYIAKNKQKKRKKKWKEKKCRSHYF